MKLKRLTLGAATLLLCAGLQLIYAQTAGTGALKGTVTDTSGAVIPGATITATNTGTGQARAVTTAADGNYDVPLLPPGTYKVEFRANGFKTVEIPGVVINVTETPVLNRAMDIGQQAEQITVEATTQTIQTDTAALGTVLAGSQVTDLPLTTRNFTNVLGLSTGVSAGVTNASALGKAGMSLAVNGGGTGSNNTLMDGVSITNFGGPQDNATDFNVYGGTAVPNPDTLQEFKVQTSLYDAGYGRNVGGNTSIVTKSGTNVIHGTAFEFFRNTDLNANDFFLNEQGKPDAILNQNQYGFTAGGPIKKNKLFFFGSWQGTRQKNGESTYGNSAVTLPPIPAGDRSNTAAFTAALGAAFCPANHPGSTLYNTFLGTNPASGGAPANAIACDGSNVNPVAVRILQAKLPNGAYFIPGSTNGSFQNVNIAIPAIYREDQYMINGDYVINSKNTLITRYFIAHNPSTLPFGSGAQLPGDTENFLGQNHAAQIKLTTIVSSSLVNELRGSMQRNINVSTGSLPFSTAQFGITPLNPGLDAQIPGFMTNINITGAPKVGGQPVNGVDFNNAYDTQFQFGDQVSWTHGKHTVRAGFEVGRIRYNWNYYGLGKGNETVNTFDDFLLGLAGCAPGSTCSATNPGLTNGTADSNIFSTSLAVILSSAGLPHSFRKTDYSAFVNDDFKVSQHLTLNLGVRYEFDGLISDKWGDNTNLWLSKIAAGPVPGSTAATGSLVGYVVPSNFVGTVPTGVTQSSTADSTISGPQKDNFAPRVGFAWQPTSGNKFVVRGGYGWFYDQVPGGNLGMVSNMEPPYGTQVNFAGAANYFATDAVPYAPEAFGQFPTRWVNFATGASSNLSFAPGLQEKFLTPLVQSYNLNVQYEIHPGWIVEAGYVGSHGIHMFGGNSENTALLASAATPINGITTNTVANASLRVPYLGFGPGGGISVNGSQFDEKFDSLQATLRKQMSHGLQMQVAYTWLKAMSDYNPVGVTPANLALDYGPSSLYHPQRVVVSYTYLIPSGSLKGFAEKALGGWSVSGVTTMQNGTPLTITNGKAGTIFGLTSSTAEICAGSTYANLATSGSVTNRLGGVNSANGYFNNAALFSSPGTPCALPVIGNGTGLGDMGVGVILGPGQFNFDTALLKSIRVGGVHENAQLAFRAEFFNASNHAQFSNPTSSVVTAGTFGQITSASVNPRIVQFALKYIF